MRQADPAAAKIGPDLLVLHVVESEGLERRAEIAGRGLRRVAGGEQPVEEGVDHADKLGPGAAGGAEGIELAAA